MMLYLQQQQQHQSVFVAKCMSIFSLLLASFCTLSVHHVHYQFLITLINYLSLSFHAQKLLNLEILSIRSFAELHVTSRKELQDNKITNSLSDKDLKVTRKLMGEYVYSCQVSKSYTFL